MYSCLFHCISLFFFLFFQFNISGIWKFHALVFDSSNVNAEAIEQIEANAKIVSVTLEAQGTKNSYKNRSNLQKVYIVTLRTYYKKIINW